MKAKVWVRVTLAISVALLAGAFTARAAQTPSVTILEPANESTVAGPDVRVRVEAEGVELGSRGRNGAHVLLRLDEMPAMKSYAERFTFRGVAVGTHRLQVELRRPDGGGFEPAVTASVEFTVTASTSSGSR
jgi:hypothetical protein